MAVENKICMNCNKSIVCSWAKTIDKFDDEVVKYPIQTVIEIKECCEYQEVVK